MQIKKKIQALGFYLRKLFEAIHKPQTKGNTSQQFNNTAVTTHSSYFCGAFGDWKIKTYITDVTEVNSAERGFWLIQALSNAFSK